jgi:hypothetical protein
MPARVPMPARLRTPEQPIAEDRPISFRYEQTISGAVPRGPYGGPGARGSVARPVSRAWGQPRRARLTADSTARMDAPVVSASTPTPQSGWPSISHSTYAAACASEPAESACSV